MDILVVEDDPLMRDLFRAILKHEGWDVRTAENGRVGLDRLVERKPDIILLDLMMPVMDGFEFLDILQQHPLWLAVPIVVVTAMELTKGQYRRLEGRIVRIFEKGSNSMLSDLVPAVKDIINNHSTSRTGAL